MTIDYSRIRGGEVTMRDSDAHPGFVSVRLRTYSKTYMFAWPAERLVDLANAIVDHLSGDREDEEFEDE
ncbi:hypothetical protein LH935_16480 [Gordonia polyisoprenivorans]|uniref:hypothetical protein n=1 Tax=Gordonia polyisoprenivorans TaxID=84595 RepID=UPI002234DE95|nr:hypothetical protein LH935_16480 [Gordonia polyisoprenivorans]